MSMLNVDIDTLYTAQQSVYNYMQYQINQTNQSSNKVNELGSSWKGVDYTRFKNKWTELTNGTSVASRTKKELESFNLYLTLCLNEFKAMQYDLTNWSNTLPKW